VKTDVMNRAGWVVALCVSAAWLAKTINDKPWDWVWVLVVAWILLAQLFIVMLDQVNRKLDIEAESRRKLFHLTEELLDEVNEEKNETR